MTGVAHDRLRLGVALIACAAILTGCTIEQAMPVGGAAEEPLSVTLTAAKPVAVFDVEADRTALPADANVLPFRLTLHGVDPRVRVAAAPYAFGQGAGALASITHPGSDGELILDTREVASTRFIIELTDPRPADRVTVAGTIGLSFYYPGTPAPGAKVTLTGFDAPELRAAPDMTTTTVAGPRLTLDADHPVALVPVTLALDQGGDVHDLASETRFVLGGDVPDGAAVPSVYMVAGAGVDAYPVLRPTSAPMDGCTLGTAAPCGGPLVLRWQWTGAVPRVELDYDMVTTLVGYGAPVASRVDTTFGDPVVVSSDARPAEAMREGTLDVAVSIGGSVIYDLALAGTPTAPAPEVVEVPGILLVTLSAKGSDGRTSPDAVLPVGLPDVNGGPTTANYESWLDLAADGVPRTLAVPVFVHCRPGATCSLEISLSAGAPRGDDVGKVTLSYSLDARVMAFAGSTLGASTSLSLTPRLSGQP